MVPARTRTVPRGAAAVAVLGIAAGLAGCSGGDDWWVPEALRAPTPTATPSASASATIEAIPSAVPVPPEGATVWLPTCAELLGPAAEQLILGGDPVLSTEWEGAESSWAATGPAGADALNAAATARACEWMSSDGTQTLTLSVAEITADQWETLDIAYRAGQYAAVDYAGTTAYEIRWHEGGSPRGAASAFVGGVWYSVSGTTGFTDFFATISTASASVARAN